MSVPKSIIWPCDPHTKAKHALLIRYLMAWFPILLSRYDHVTYAEGFAGPGVYSSGEAGSPIFAYRQASAALSTRPRKTVQMVLAEADASRIARLRQEMAHADRQMPQVKIAYREGECGDVLLDALAATFASKGPIFAFLDSFGGPDIPYRILPAIAAHRASEVLLTFAPSFLTRFGQKSASRQAGDAVFGGDHWQRVSEMPKSAKFTFLLDAYRESLHTAGFEHTLCFEMIDEGGHRLWLLFATNHPRGIEKMKDAMWTVDPIYGVRYRDPRDPNQETLEIEVLPDTGPLRSELLEYLSRLPSGASLQDLRDFALLQTVYKPTQVTPLVRQLVKTARIERVGKGPLSGKSVVRLKAPSADAALFNL